MTTHALENLFNRINDWDGTWIGFRRLKPAPSESMSIRTVLVLSSFCAPVTALIVAVVCYGLGLRGGQIWVCSIAAAVAFIFLQSLSAFFWSRRASRLREAEAKKQP